MGVPVGGDKNFAGADEIAGGQIAFMDPTMNVQHCFTSSCDYHPILDITLQDQLLDEFIL